ncbi:PREDICTED: probable inactive ATP-dependent zinc metalloprotease FTSHI 5, chloroplastic isoform X2 [Ipomoea nil]|uniref:probable inactive ATP-dependent zinc metalloprotease FTSHI 5, chloroplastic isoform X2 n=1 Tax=Ipomoea nil TaxID=35883 RepID=UPI000901B9A8|nr:PREDICTED: probable inactive ATP-dependent zinc metalloprotease FTSHI 5, chloroplastic isoform X2 [Ipomoea nil]
MSFTVTTLLTSSAPCIPPSFISPNYTNSRLRTRKFIVKSSAKRNESRNFFRAGIKFPPFQNLEASSIDIKGRDSPSTSIYNNNNDESLLNSITKPIACALFCIALGFFPITGFRVPAAIAAPPVKTWLFGSRQKVEKDVKGHKYSRYTERLLDAVPSLLRGVQLVKSGRMSVGDLENRLDYVIDLRERLQQEIMDKLYANTRDFKEERGMLLQQTEEILKSVLKAKMEEESLLRNAQGNDVAVKGEIEEVQEKINRNVEEYNRAWERIYQIDDEITQREAVALNIGVRELLSIQQECVTLVGNCLERIKMPRNKSMPVSSLTKLSRSEIKETLQNSQIQLLKETVLPNILENEDIGFDEETVAFAQRIKQALHESHEMQRNLESDIRKKLKRYGDEKKLVVNTPVDEVVKGFPEIELKWMFGKKEVVVPKAVSTHLYHGWKKWREEVKGDLKRNLLENADFGQKYVAERQERILLDRDRVVSKTWYNEEKDRWEMDPIAVPYAVSRKLVESARIRHDWAIMFINLKGDDKEYYVDIKEFDLIFEEFGGFDGLYLRMLSSKIPTVVQLMWIPFLELKIHQQFLLIANLCNQCLAGLWNSPIVSYRRDWLWTKVGNITEDIMMMIVFPVLDNVIPYRLRMQLGMAWPERAEDSASSSWYLKCQAIAERRFTARKTDGFWWYIWFLTRAAIFGYVLYYVVWFMTRKIPRMIGFGPLRRDPNFKKLRRLKAYFNYRTGKIKRKKRAGIDPISTAFDQMKRIKNPPIRLKDFASIDSMKEEIYEVVAFLQNPRAFQEMGARAPRGVLIVGERGTGKTSLAMAIAAESKVPVVEVKAQQLEGDLWVGQSASNVRELFQTARDLAPVIIFVEDFDLFAGVRGKFVHTKKQDHEAFINQLLVELDGFEKHEGVVLMATTRNLSQIDEALQRPGRMDRVFHLQRPTQVERENILKSAAKETMDEEFIDSVDWRKVAEKTALLRPIELKLVPVALEGSAFRSKFLDLEELMSYCSWFATFSGLVPNWVRKTRIMKKFSKILINHLGLTLTKEDLDNVVDLMEPYGQISNGIEFLNPPLDWTRETKFPHAVWAAGRSLIALLLPNFDVVDNLWLEPFSWEVACGLIKPCAVYSFLGTLLL